YTDSDIVKLKNPIVETMKVMRTSMVSSMLDAVKYNFNHRNMDLRFFEIGKTYFAKNGSTQRPSPTETVATENEYVCGVCTGRVIDTADWTRGAKIEQSDFYTLKGEIVALLNALRIPSFEFVELDTDKIKYLHPGASSAIKCCGRICGYIGKVHPDLANKFDIGDQDIYVFEISLDLIKELVNAGLSGKELPKFPRIRRDLSFLIPASIKDSQICSVIKKAKAQNLKEYGVFDLYKGKGIPEDQKSMAYYFVFASDERTLSDSEVEEAMVKIIDGLKKEFLINMRT
ncbi:MAG: hypothetical protein WCQ47_09135, partial [bacterium]